MQQVLLQRHVLRLWRFSSPSPGAFLPWPTPRARHPQLQQCTFLPYIGKKEKIKTGEGAKSRLDWPFSALFIVSFYFEENLPFCSACFFSDFVGSFGGLNPSEALMCLLCLC